MSNITVIKEKDFSFSVQIDPPNGKTYLLSSDSFEQSAEWREALIEAARRGDKSLIRTESVKNSRAESGSKSKKRKTPEKSFDEKENKKK